MFGEAERAERAEMRVWSFEGEEQVCVVVVKYWSCVRHYLQRKW